MAGLKPQELIIILIIILVLFGGNKLPDLARSLGSAQREFKQGLEEGSSVDPPMTESAESQEEPDQDSPSQGAS